MNLRLGRFGKQEAAGVCGLSALMSGMFTVYTQEAYGRGNVRWLASLLGLLGAALLFLLLMEAMERLRVLSLWGLLQRAAGRFLGGVLGIICILLLVLSAALPNLQLLTAMNRYVFEGADYRQIAPYMLAAVVLLGVLGMECIARTGRLLVLPGVVSVGLAVFLASPAFGWYHLFPLLGAGLEELLRQSLQSLLGFLPGVAALCVVGEGCQNRDALRKSGFVGLMLGGLLGVGMELALGLSCYSWDISTQSVPLCYMTMATRYDAVTVRLDVTVLFLWVVCALWTGAFYVYAGSLLFCKLTGLKDIRPVATGLGSLAMMAMLVLYLDAGWIETLTGVIYRWGWVLGVLPLGVVLVLRVIRGRKKIKKSEE